MFADLPFAITVKRRRGGTDRFGDPLPATIVDLPGCASWPTSSTETADYSDQVSTGRQLHVPAGTDLLATDEVLLPGEDAAGSWWQIDGDVIEWGPSPFTGDVPGAIVTLTRTRG